MRINKKQAVKIVATGRPRKSMTKLVNDLTDVLQEHFWKLFAYSSSRPTSIDEWLETLNKYLPKLRIYNVPKVGKTTNVSKEYLKDAWVDTMFGNSQDITVLINNWKEEGFPNITINKNQHEKLKKLVEKYIDLIFSEGKLSITDVGFLKSNKT